MEKPRDHWTQYLFREHSENTIRKWARRLHLFRFVRAVGGMSNDDDELIVVFPYQNTDELLTFFKFAGIKTVEHTTEPPQQFPGTTLQGKALIQETRWIEQPGLCQIAGQKVFVWCRDGQIRISISGGGDVHRAEVARAEIVEKVLKDSPLPHLEPPLDHKRCICPKYYPYYFR